LKLGIGGCALFLHLGDKGSVHGAAGDGEIRIKLDGELLVILLRPSGDDGDGDEEGNERAAFHAGVDCKPMRRRRQGRFVSWRRRKFISALPGA
jgi:hypothetical protein